MPGAGRHKAVALGSRRKAEGKREKKEDRLQKSGDRTRKARAQKTEDPC